MIAAWILFAAASQASPPPATPIAVVDHVTIRFGSIRCGSLLRDDAAACARVQQERLSSRIAEIWIDAAARLNNIVLTSDDEKQIDAEVSRETPRAMEEAKRYRKIVAAVLRIRRGEDEATVLADAQQPGITAMDIRQMEEILPTVESAEHAAAKDMAADIERLTRDRERRRLLSQKIRDLLQRKAASAHTTFQKIAKDFWSGVAGQTETRILDPAYRLPDSDEIMRTQ